MDHLSFAVVHADQLAIHASFHRDRGERRHRAQTVEVNRDVASPGRTGGNGNRRR